MTIDEAIAHAREASAIQRNNDKLNKTLGESSPYYNTDCLKCAEEHEQLAEWLEKLKAYESHYCSLCEKFGVNSIEEIYNKAIDDFAKEMIRSFLTENEKEYIRYKAEQLKEGGAEE